MSSAKVTDNKPTQLLWLLKKFTPKRLAFHREKPIHASQCFALDKVKRETKVSLGLELKVHLEYFYGSGFKK